MKNKVVKPKEYFINLKNKIIAPFKGGKSSKFKIGLTKFAKAILTMIAVLPVAGILIVLGKVIGPLGFGQITSIAPGANHIGRIIETIGWLPFTHIGLLFAIAIGGAWSKNRAGGCFASAISYFVLLVVGSTFFLTRESIAADGTKTTQFMNYILGGKWENQAGYFAEQEGVHSLRFDALGGIITGFIGAYAYNKFYKFDRLPNALSFFNGPRFVPLMVIAITLPIALALALFWPLVQTGINAIGKNIALNNKIPFLIPFGYGFLERILLPFGLHHMITIPMNYTSLGGVLDFTNSNTFSAVIKDNHLINAEQLADFFKWAGQNNIVDLKNLKAEGQEPMWFTWITALGVTKSHWNEYVTTVGPSTASTAQVYELVMNSFEPVRFKVGQMITSTGSLMGAGLGMMYAIQKSKRIKFKSIYISGGLACLLTGVTEPIEFIFMYTAPLLYVIHALLTAVAFGMVDVIPMRIHAFGSIEIILKYFLVLGPSSLITSDLKTNLWLDGVWFLLTTAVFMAIYFVIFYFLSRWLKPLIPGFEEEIPIEDQIVILSSTDPPLLNQQNPKKTNAKDAIIIKIIELFGGAQNIVEVDACMTRLRVTVKEPTLVVDNFKEATNSIGIVKQGNYFQVVYGPKASVYKEKIAEYLENSSEGNKKNE